jgi:hypothetical protein
MDERTHTPASACRQDLRAALRCLRVSAWMPVPVFFPSSATRCGDRRIIGFLTPVERMPRLFLHARCLALAATTAAMARLVVTCGGPLLVWVWIRTRRPGTRLSAGNAPAAADITPPAPPPLACLPINACLSRVLLTKEKGFLYMRRDCVSSKHTRA